MSVLRGKWKLLVAVLVCLVLMAVAGGGGVYLYLLNRNRTWLGMAVDAYDRGDWMKAKVYYEWYLPQDPGNLDALEKYARANLKILDDRPAALQRAAIAYNQMLSYDSDNAEVRAKLLELYEKLNSWGDVVYFAELFLSDHPDAAELLIWRAKALDRLGRRDEAVTAYREVIDRGIATAEVFANLARVYKGRGFNQQAMEALDEGLKARPDDPATYVERARYFLDERDRDRAEAELRKALEIAPDDIGALVVGTRLAAARGEWRDVIETGQAIVARDPSQASVYLALAQAFRSTGDDEKSLAVLVSVDPAVRADHPDLFMSLAETQLAAGLVDDARTTIEDFAKTYPEQRGAREYLESRLLLAEDDTEAAARKLAVVVEQNPGLPVAEFYLAVAQLRTGKRDSARSHLESYLRKNPGDENARALLERELQGERSLTEVADAARAMSDKQGAPAVALTSAAYALSDAASRERVLPEYRDLLDGLFEKAIQSDPRAAAPYAGLAQLRAALGDLDGARDALRRGIAAGIDEARFAQDSAAIAIAGGDVDGAWQSFTESLAAPGTTPEDVAKWASLFFLRGRAELADKCLDEGMRHFGDGEACALLAVEKVHLALRGGDGEGAFTLLNDAKSRAEGHERATDKLNEARIVLVGWLLDQGSEEMMTKAEALLSEAKALDPENAQVLAQEGRVLARRTPPDMAGAEDAFTRSLRADSGNVQALMGMAFVTSSRGELSKAVEYADRAVGLAPQVVGLRLYRAELLIRMKRYLEAADSLERIVDKNSVNVAALELLVGAYVASGNLDKAEDTLARFENTEGGDPAVAARIGTLRGRIRAARGESAEAEQMLRKQYESKPDDLNTVSALAAVLLNAGALEEGEGLLKAYTDKHAEDAAGYVALARFYTQTGDRAKLDLASTALTRALLVDGDNLSALREMIEVQSRMGRMAGVLAACERYLVKEPNDPMVLYIKASYLRRDPGGLDEALDAISRAIEQERRTDYLGLRGVILLDKGDYEKALEDLRAASREVANISTDMEAAFAEAYLGIGDKGLARSHYDAAFRGSPKEGGEAWARLKRVEKGLQ